MRILGTVASSSREVPGAPTIGTATNVPSGRAYNNGRADVTFTAPAFDGGLPITSYTVTSSPGGFTGSGASSPLTVTGLQSNTAYTFTVTAANSLGNSAASSASNSITATTVPQAPTIGTASGGSGGVVSVPFTAGATGGSTITGFTATSTSTRTGTNTVSPITVNEIAAGTYTYTVTATNANGTSAASAASNSVTSSFLDISGGQETRTVGGYKYLVFTTTGNLTVSGGFQNVQVLLVGGGGAGGALTGGGGGGGAIEPLSGYSTVGCPAGTQSITIGAGTIGSTNLSRSAQGGTTIFGSSILTALGGGSGGPEGNNGGPGGSGGGGSRANGGPGNGSNAFAGGRGASAGNYGGGGGGGGSANGQDHQSTQAGNGGAGKLFSNIDSNLTAANFPTTLSGLTAFAGGGGGGALGAGATTSSGGNGGGGAGSPNQFAPSNATGYGSGGGGSGWNNTWSAGGNGSNGIVIVRVPV
jgi:trimeric autotransporter adhesin